LSDILKLLTSELDRDLRNQIKRRVDALERGIKYMQETNNERLAALQRQGWSIDRIEVICALNAFYQSVLGPLASSARERVGVLGEEIPILYGDLIRFDADRNSKIRSAHKAFADIISGLPGGLQLITANHASDIVYSLDKALNENGGN